MKDFFRKVWEFIKYPNIWFLVATICLTIVGVVGIALCYIYYPVQGLCLTVTSITAVLGSYSIAVLVVRGRRYYQSILRDKLYFHHIVGKYFTDYGAKTMLFALLSLIINVGIAIMHGVNGITKLSIWYGALAGYYIALTALRSTILICNRKIYKRQDKTEYDIEISKIRVYLLIGILLLLLELVMSAAVTQMVLSSRPVQNGMIYCIAMAAYTFYKVAMVIINLVKAKKHGDPIIQAIRNVNLADICVSILSLTVMMLAMNEGGDMIALKACVGFGTILIIAIVAIVMILRSIAYLKKVKNNGTRRTGQE